MSRNARQAKQLFEDFTGHPGEEFDTVEIDDYDTVIVIGTLDAVEYTTVRDGKTIPYRHEFKARSRPALCVSPDGQQLFVLGGNYLFTDQGITDQ